MKILRLAAALGLGVMLGACGASDVVTRDVPFEVQPRLAAPAPAAMQLQPAAIAQHINVAQVNVTVPQRLRVSEANRYYPNADIVWRGDPIGDRHAQVAQILNTAFTAGTVGFSGPKPVILDVELVRFHSLSEKARYTVGGVHNIRFSFQVRDAQTGAPLTERREVNADLDAFGGQQAINAEAQGQTQKVRVTDFLAEVIRQELTRPEGYENAGLGFFQLVNKI